MAFLIVGSLLGLVSSQCNIATITNEFTGSISDSSHVAAWDGKVAFQIPAGSCIALYAQGFGEYSGSWQCMSDSNGDYYMQYNIYSDTSTCSGNPISTTDVSNFFTTLHAIATNPYFGGYAFTNKAQAELVLNTGFLGLAKFQATSYYTGDIQCGQANDCGATVTQALYSNGDECSGDPIARTVFGNLVSGLCAVSVNVQLNLNIDCDLLENMGYNVTEYFGGYTGICDDTVDANAQFSMGYVCRDDALWLLAYDDANCQGSYTGLRINELCYTFGLGSYSLEISCANPNFAGSLNLVHQNGDEVELGLSASDSHIYSIMYSIIFVIFIVIFV